MTQHVSPASLDGYTQALRLGMDDKLFFVEHIPDDVSVFVDYGCADGSTLRATSMACFGRPGYGQNVYIGYDHDPDMISAAEQRTDFDPAFTFVANLPALKRELEVHHMGGRKSCLILSSVVHEILSQDGVIFQTFWDVVHSLGCDYIAFRDMALEARLQAENTPQLWYGAAFVREDAQDIARAMSFEQTHGPLTVRSNFIHFLLKAIHPIEDWSKELAENYLPHSAEAYLNLMTVGSGYKLRHFAHTALPGLQAAVHAQFGIRVPDLTHVKIVLKKGC